MAVCRQIIGPTIVPGSVSGVNFGAPFGAPFWSFFWGSVSDLVGRSKHGQSFKGLRDLGYARARPLFWSDRGILRGLRDNVKGQ